MWGSECFWSPPDDRSTIINNYSPNWRWIYLAASRLGKHPQLSPTLSSGIATSIVWQLFLLLSTSTNYKSGRLLASMWWSVRTDWSPKGVCRSHFPIRSQGRNCTIYHFSRTRIFLTNPSVLPWPHYHVVSYILSVPILSNRWRCDLQFHFCLCTFYI